MSNGRSGSNQTDFYKIVIERNLERDTFTSFYVNFDKARLR